MEGRSPSSSSADDEILCLKKIRRGEKTVQWTVFSWGTLSRGSPLNLSLFLSENIGDKEQYC